MVSFEEWMANRATAKSKEQSQYEELLNEYTEVKNLLRHCTDMLNDGKTEYASDMHKFRRIVGEMKPKVERAKAILDCPDSFLDELVG